VTTERFASVYLQTLLDLSALWNADMQSEIAQHNIGWVPGRTDFEGYLRCSLVRYEYAMTAIKSVGATSVCDVGGFLGVFPVTLSRLGFDVAMTESPRYYSHAFDAAFERIAAEGVTIIDVDLFNETAGDRQKGFDVVTLMAVLEHYPHSLRTALNNVVQLLSPRGHLYVETPNIAYWPKRWNMLHGQSPLVPATDIFDSAVPFIGHHHEFAPDELEELLRRAGFEPLRQWLFNYSRPRVDTWQKLAWRIRPAGWGENIEDLIFRWWPRTRECVSLLCRAPLEAVDGTGTDA
jgi:2-polyprenyl-3-methyl-5-hydroxy-6-metoxy-1,4-benzoquinol methylase